MSVREEYISEYYDLIFRNREWIRRITEKIHIEDPQDTKKSRTFDISIPYKLLSWDHIEPSNPYASERKILPLMFIKKSTLKDVDVTIDKSPLSVTTKKFNEEIEKSLKEESEKRLDKEIEDVSISILQDRLKKIKSEIKEVFKNLSNEGGNEKAENKVSYINLKINSLIKNLESEDKAKEKLKAYYFIYRLFHRHFLFSVLLPINYYEKDRVIVKVSFELPIKDSSTNQKYKEYSYKNIFNLFSQEHKLDELEYKLETTLLPYSHHILIDLPEGMEATDFRYNCDSKDDDNDTLESKDDSKNISNIKNGKIYVNKDLKNCINCEEEEEEEEENKIYELNATTIKYRVVPGNQGIRRWSFMLSWVVPLLVVFSIFVNFNKLVKDSGERSAVVTVLATFSVLFIVWMAKGTEIPIYAKTVSPLRLSILLYLIGTYLTIIVVILGDGSKSSDSVYTGSNTTNLFFWESGWVLIYTVLSIATGYSLIVHLYYYNLRSGHMTWNKKWKIIRWFCIFFGILGSLILFPIICYLNVNGNPSESVDIFEWAIIGINIIYLFLVFIIGFNKTFRPNPNLKSKSTMWSRIKFWWIYIALLIIIMSNSS